MDGSRRLLTFELIGVCLVSFLAICNLTAFYDLFQYLEALGVRPGLRGIVVGSYSLTAMVLFLVASPLLHAGNATRVMLAGMAILVAAGVSYLFAHAFWSLLALRMIGGVGQFCLSAGAMALLVAVIPPEKSGQAFGIYSVAILLGYAVLPAVMDAFAPLIPTPAHGYAAATVWLAPAALIVLRIRQRQRRRSGERTRRPVLPTWPEVRANMGKPLVLLPLLLNTSYFLNWSSLFFLFKGFARRQGIANVGAFFTVQMGVMVLMRLAGGRVFDRVDKARLAGASFTTVALGYLALDLLPGPWAISPVAGLFGLGMAAGYPAINGFMFEVSEPRFRALNANLMLFAVQAGSFLGPVIGGALVARDGYHAYFRFGIAAALASASLVPLLARRRRTLDSACVPPGR